MSELLEQIKALEASADINSRENEFRALQEQYLEQPTEKVKEKIWLLMASAVKAAIAKELSKNHITYDTDEMEEIMMDATIDYWRYTLGKGKPVLGKLSGYAYFVVKHHMYSKSKIFNDNIELLEKDMDEEEMDKDIMVEIFGTNMLIEDNTAYIDKWKITITDNDNLLIESLGEHMYSFTYVMYGIYVLTGYNHTEYITVSCLDRNNSKPNFSYEPFLKKASKLGLCSYYQIDDSNWAVRRA